MSLNAHAYYFLTSDKTIADPEKTTTTGRTTIHKSVIRPIGLEARKASIERSTESTPAILFRVFDTKLDKIKYDEAIASDDQNAQKRR